MVGVFLSINDYRNWKKEETKNYGHGPLEKLALPLELAVRYQNDVAGIRLRYPQDWIAKDQTLFLAASYKIPTSWKTLLGVEKRYQVTTILSSDEVDPTVKIDLYEQRAINPDVTTVLEREAKKLESEGIVFSRNRDYLNTNRENWMVLTWEKGEKTFRYGIAVRGERIVIVIASCNKSELDKWIRTLDEITKSSVLI